MDFFPDLMNSCEKKEYAVSQLDIMLLFLDRWTNTRKKKSNTKSHKSKAFLSALYEVINSICLSSLYTTNVRMCGKSEHVRTGVLSLVFFCLVIIPFIVVSRIQISNEKFYSFLFTIFTLMRFYLGLQSLAMLERKHE
jgi:hypothetical protein